MPVWNNIQLTNPITGEFDVKNVEVELNRRLRYYLDHIDVASILFNLNDIDGTLILSKGGTGSSLVAPVVDSMMFYDLSGVAVGWLTAGAGLVISGTTMIATGGVGNYDTITATTTLLDATQGIINCRAVSDITVTLSTAITTQALSFFISNNSTNSNTVTIDPAGAGTRTIQYDSSLILYPDESVNVAFDGTSDWLIR